MSNISSDFFLSDKSIATGFVRQSPRTSLI
jgi:hypothetical protein